MQRLRKKVERVISSDVAHPFFSGATLFQIISSLYAGVVTTRNLMYERHLLPSHKVPCRVVSIGNLAVGGTGKTPMTVFLTRWIQELGYHPVILSRGYKGRYERQGAVVSDGCSIQCDASRAGDEPFLIANLLPAVPVIVGSDRIASARLAIERFEPDVLVLDDAFQHRRLYRDLDLLLLDDRAPFGNRFMLPRGPLREPVAALRRSHAIVLTRCSDSTSSGYRHVCRMAGPRPVFRSHHQPVVRGVLPAGDPAAYRNLKPFSVAQRSRSGGRRMFAFSGLARNQSFRDSIPGPVGSLAGHMAFEDHHPYNSADVKRIAVAAHDRSCNCLVTTDKDYVRLPSSSTFPLPVLVMGIQMDFKADRNPFYRFIEQRFRQWFDGRGHAAENERQFRDSPRMQKDQMQ
jgi:tetraacyldisaccharide 4'-kinase